MQKVPMVGITPGADTRFAFVAKGKGVDLKPLDEYVAFDQTQQPASDIDAEIVYVGYGIEAPEYNWDDYKGVDRKGQKFCSCWSNQPTTIPSFSMAKPSPIMGAGLTNMRKRRGKAPSARYWCTGLTWRVIRGGTCGIRIPRAFVSEGWMALPS